MLGRPLEVFTYRYLNSLNLIPAPLNPKEESQTKAVPSIEGLYLLSLTSCRLIFESSDPKMSRL